MKKVIAVLLSVMLLAVCALAMAEEANVGKKIVGIWYLNQQTINGETYDVSQMEDQNIFEFKEDNTGVLYRKNDPDNKQQLAWTEDGGKVWMQSENVQENLEIRIVEDETEGVKSLVIGDDSNNYILSRTPAEPVNFASTIKAEKAEDFDGHYALTYLAGDGYTMPAEKAADDLAVLGVKTTEIAIESGLVELFGNEPRAYEFNETEGSLDMEVDDKVNFLNVYIYKTEDGGLAINWLDLTFYAAPIA